MLWAPPSVAAQEAARHHQKQSTGYFDPVAPPHPQARPFGHWAAAAGQRQRQRRVVGRFADSSYLANFGFAGAQSIGWRLVGFAEVPHTALVGGLAAFACSCDIACTRKRQRQHQLHRHQTIRMLTACPSGANLLWHRREGISSRMTGCRTGKGCGLRRSARPWASSTRCACRF